MPRVRNILVPIDTHENAAPIVQWATLFAHAIHSSLTLLHVNESVEFMAARPGLHGGGFAGMDLMMDKWRQQYHQDTRATLDQLTQQYCSGVSVSVLILEGRAHPVILGAVESTNSDLVVIGTHGRPWYQRAFLGSTAEAVLRASEVPVLIVHNSVPPPRVPSVERVLFSTDFSPASRAGEEWLYSLAQHGVREVFLVHAIENPLLDVYSPDTADLDPRQVSDASRDHPPRSAQPFWEHAHQVARTKLQAVRQQVLGPSSQILQAETLVVEGTASSVILNACERHHVDFIVMATHGRTGVRRFVLGSVTEKIIRSASCPVLVIPSKEA